MCGTAVKVRVHGFMEVSKKLGCSRSFIGDEGADALDFAEEYAIRLTKLNAADITFVFDDATHISPSAQMFK